MVIYGNIKISSFQVGFSNAVLYVIYSNKEFLKFSEIPIYGLLPLLEFDYKEVCKTLQISNEILDDNFPFLELLKFPFVDKREDWCYNSLKWIIDSDKKDELLLWSKSFDTNWMSQKLKHKFKKAFPPRSA